MKSGVLGERFGAAEHLVASFLWTVEDLAYNVHLEDVTLHVNLTLAGVKEKWDEFVIKMSPIGWPGWPMD